ncbi:MAG: hypothetical protein M1515_01765 [Candidatus Thermoplasmatota archaeon]|nr:hypothetical protein [Candidatus Thermoplasmatota archaeon]
MKVDGNRVIGFLSFIMLLGAVVFYLSWSIAYGAWTDIGLYSISIVLIMFGFLGILLSKARQKEVSIS